MFEGPIYDRLSVERIAVIDLGSNSTRLLIAELHDGTLTELERRSEVTRLGEGVDATGRLADGAMERVFETLSRYRGLIDAAGVDRVAAVATSAVRDSDNREAFRAELRRRLGIEARTISGDEEARLTFLGATSGRDGAGSEMLVVDVGGGSTELVAGDPGAEPGFHISTRAGSVRQTERHLHDDPPSPEQLLDLRQEVRAIFAQGVPARVREAVGGAIAVAGTATSLAAIDQGLERYDPRRVEGYRLKLAACEGMLAMLAARSLGERRAVTGLDPSRAPTIVAGAAILVEAMRAFRLCQFVTSEADILQGVARMAHGVTL